ncbi:Fic family protein [Psychrobacillus sp. OK032]|uniref:Fic/DOC family protein n=1 Tax=Psychrobacillus sp. OK032 TaxID=1884358 RepID=UPI0008BE7A33|nr:Fic family protein [Psychrobacillus sp. OK032]SES20139.1 cell filamentation protein [Psychrobacillus sp. OK032]
MAKYNEFNNDDYLLKTNLLDINDFDELEQAEAFTFSIRAAQIEQGAYKITAFSKKDFVDLHYQLFQDIYSFAGQFRKVQLMKGTTRFCQVQFLDAYASDLFNQLQNEPAWDSLVLAAKRLAYFKSELNMLHPFREGNGRTTRIFLQEYTQSKGFFWNYNKIDRNDYMQAMIRSVTSEDLLENLFLKTLIRVN